MKKTLIYTQKEDVHADLVTHRMNQLGFPWVRVNGDEVPEVTSFEFSSDGDGEIIGLGGRTRLSEIGSVWRRRRKKPLANESIGDAGVRRWAQQENLAALDGALMMLGSEYWVNPEANAVRANSKIVQLAVARSVGFRVPDTYIGSDAERVRTLMIESPCGVVYKPLHSGVVMRDGGEYHMIFTTRITEDHLRGGGGIDLAHGIFQRYVEKRLELRLTIVGTKVFTCGIMSQEHERTSVDWRHYHSNMVHVAQDLPGDMEEKVLSLMAYLGLQFATVDMVWTPQGEYVFLEVNQMGQWVWIERETGLEISRSMAILLGTQGKEHEK